MSVVLIVILQLNQLMKMKTIKIELTDKEYSKLSKIKTSDPQNRCHHNWHEFIMRIAKFYEKQKIKNES